jgi:hypothetical protein
MNVPALRQWHVKRQLDKERAQPIQFGSNMKPANCGSI